MSDTKLLPCPFCGGTNVTCREQWNTAAQFCGYVVCCWNCHIETWVCHSEAEAIATWNTRAEKTCMVEKIETDEYGHWVYTSCGHVTLSHGKPRYCSTCGAKVVEHGI